MRQSPHRGRIEMLTHTLEAVRRHDTPVRIMYASNTSWKPLKKNLEYLDKRGLIQCHRKGSRNRRYYITDKGGEALKTMKRLLGFLGVEVELITPQTSQVVF